MLIARNIDDFAYKLVYTSDIIELGFSLFGIRLDLDKVIAVVMDMVYCEYGSLEWRHNGRDSVSNHQPHVCILNRLFRRRSKKTSNSASLAFARGIQRWPVNSRHKWPVTRKMFPFDDVIMYFFSRVQYHAVDLWNLLSDVIKIFHVANISNVIYVKKIQWIFFTILTQEMPQVTGVAKRSQIATNDDNILHNLKVVPSYCYCCLILHFVM